MPDQTPRDSAAMNEGEILLYRTPDGAVRVEVFFRDETFWLTQARMAELFGSSKQLVSYHLRNIFETKELARGATVKEILTVQNEGGREVARNVEYYNLDAVIDPNGNAAYYYYTRLSHLCGGVRPGQTQDADFVLGSGFGVCWA